MGVGIIVHGYIECPGMSWQEPDKSVFRHNRKIIDRLPLKDDWPMICKSMFSVLPLNNRNDGVYLPQYDKGVIHFAGDYKGMWVLDDAWIHKFEDRLLSKLCWFKAVVRVCGYLYEWKTDHRNVWNLYSSIPPKPPRQWEFSCYLEHQSTVHPSRILDRNFRSKYHSVSDSSPNSPPSPPDISSGCDHL